MTNVEGVAAEETTVEESVENPTPEEAKAEDTEQVEEAESGEDSKDDEAPQEAEFTDEELAELENDPKVKALIKKKQESHRNALRHNQDAIKKRNEKIRESEERIKAQEQRIAELEAKEVDELDRSTFETEEDYEEAERKKAIQDALHEEKLNEAKAELNAETQEMLAAARDNFETQLTEFRETEPDVDQNLNVVADYLDMLPQNDPGVYEFRKYLTRTCENPVQLSNYLGKNPDVIEDQLVGKPWPIVKKRLQKIEQELSAPKKEPPASEPLPKPLSKTKGAATISPSAEKLADPEAFMRWRQSQLKKQ